MVAGFYLTQYAFYAYYPTEMDEYTWRYYTGAIAASASFMWIFLDVWIAWATSIPGDRR